MEDSNIVYTGITQATSDLDCRDGDLSLSHNLISRNGAMCPVTWPDTEFTLGEGETLLYVHHTSAYRHFIVSTSGRLGFYDEAMQYTPIEGYDEAYGIQSVTSVGNTLIIVADSGLHYFLYADGTYEYLGQKPPETVISFSLTGESVVLVKSESSSDEQSLWMIQKNKGDATWQSPVRVSGEVQDVHTGDWKTYVFRRGQFNLSGIDFIKPDPPTGNDPLPDGWLDVPDGKNGFDAWCLCIGSVSLSSETISWSPVYAIHAITDTDPMEFRFAANNEKDTAPVCDTSAENPPGWDENPPVINKNAETTFDVSITDGIAKSTYDSLEKGSLNRLELSEQDQSDVSTDVMGKVAMWVAEATDENRFVYPFFVRYAYKLYDGSHFMQSAPVLMVPNSSGRASVIINRLTGEDDTIKTLHYQVVGPRVCLEIHSIDRDERLSKWKDVVTGIDIFVSEQFYNYLPDGKIEHLYNTSAYRYHDAYTVSRLSSYYNFGTHMYTYLKRGIFSPEALYGTTVMGEPDEEGNYPIGGMVFDLPEIEESQTEYLERIRSNGTFYLFRSYAIDEEDEDCIRVGEVEAEEHCLRNIVHQITLKDDYQTHDLIKPQYAFVYNQRLNLANISRTLFNGFPAEMQVGYNVNRDPSLDLELKYPYTIYVFIHTDQGKDVVVRAASGEAVYYFTDYLFYPNPKAYKAVIVRQDYFPAYTEVKLTEHKALNGAYWFSAFQDEMVYGTSVDEPTPTDKTVTDSNKIYTSEVGNPFYFPLEGVNTVGVGQIVGISSITRALSQGQFGQFPLLVFATDGIWALEVSDTGLYSAKQPISRDVCSNSRSITQTDGAVIFVSDKGVMIVEGSNVSLLSAELDGPSFDPSTVSRLDDLLEKEGFSEELGDIGPAKAFFADCLIAYDYPNARLLLFRPESRYAYLYSLLSRTWATVSSDFVTAVPDYPLCYLQRTGGEVLNLSQKEDYDSGKEVPTLLLSRPLKLGDDAFKTINIVLTRGHLRRDTGGTMVFASHDGHTYVPIGSAAGHRVSRLQGSPYRYFRLAIVRRMKSNESVSLTSVYYTRKWRNKPR